MPDLDRSLKLGSALEKLALRIATEKLARSYGRLQPRSLRKLKFSLDCIVTIRGRRPHNGKQPRTTAPAANPKPKKEDICCVCIIYRDGFKICTGDCCK